MLLALFNHSQGGKRDCYPDCSPGDSKQTLTVQIRQTTSQAMSHDGLEKDPAQAGEKPKHWTCTGL